MPIPAIVIFEIIPTIAHVLETVGLLGAIGGSMGGWCALHCPPRDIGQLISTDTPVNSPGDGVGPCNVPQYNFDMCRDAVKNIQVTSSNPRPGVAQFDNVPFQCMDLVTVLAGSCDGEGARPVPCGSACVQYTGLTDAQMGSLSLSLNAH
ncbi:hypothetical protein PFICI_09143 [Pestalotiopsis fici W106-1]|uniref:Uncharacterized protein n=1 Tax=Pestalotiopsis fici (strain W106-1 / CGMCC3.15140) TaxID=1229662 RepID=W3WZM4_PESFW|nr:uncharacterized protein PFICI_09143 [Pestalotiopsis fici W106-1]ETS79290.1 hypothetical protein PFICI_09143 [Pestalotiopsis fici W106-1]